MATKRNLLEEAIADAKTVKEMAIANAKAALEEAFTPQLNSLFSLKLEEMEDLEDLEDDIEGLENDVEDLEDDFEEIEHSDEVDLEELLAELNEEKKSEDDEESEDEEEKEKDDDTPIGDLTKEELEKMIEDIIAEEFPELQKHEEGESDEEEKAEHGMGGEEFEEEDIELAEILAEIAAMDEMETDPDEYKDEYVTDKTEHDDKPYSKGEATRISKYKGVKEGGFGTMDDEHEGFGKMKHAMDENEDEMYEGKSMEELEAELAEAYSTIETLRGDLNEVNLLNAKLLYTNKIFKGKNLNENQKVKVLSSFDKATSVSEVKLVFETLNEGLNVKKPLIKENLGRASKPTNTPQVKKPIVESNEAFLRMQKLAGII